MKKYLVFVGLLLLAVSLSAQEKNATRRKYRPSAEFLQNDNPACFEATKAEADRAFDLHYWDDAGKLYRAAKNCADANQTNRAWLNQRIEACRKAAEDELLAAQAEAFRRERHAVAANRANDAQEMLGRFDRSLAFRLADFANEYIAPPEEDNPDCIQALLETWNYNPRVHSNYTAADQLQVPFAYELGRNLGDSVQVRFLGEKTNRKLYAFSPIKHELNCWRMSDFGLERTLKMDTLLDFFEASPDGQTLVFGGNGRLLLWRGPRAQHTLVAPGVGHLCFDATGDNLYFDDVVAKQVYVLSVKELFNPVVQQQSNVKSRYATKKASVTPQVFVENLPADWLALAIDRGALWVGYADSLLLYTPPQTNVGTPAVWRSIPYNLPRTETVNYGPKWQSLRLFPEQHRAILVTPAQNYNLNFSTSVGLADFTIRPSNQVPLTLLAEVKGTNYGAISTLEVGPFADYVGAPRYLAPLGSDDSFAWFSGCLGLDRTRAGGEAPAQWLAAVSTSGVLKIWELKYLLNGADQNLRMQGQSTFNNDGSLLINLHNGHVRVLGADASNASGQFNSIRLNYKTDYVGGTQAIGGDWAAAWQSGCDSVVLFRCSGPSRTVYLPLPENNQQPLSFSKTGDLFAYALDGDSVAVYSLDNQGVKFLQGRRFGAHVTHLEFIPNSSKMLVQRGAYGDEPPPSLTIPKIWDYKLPASAPLASVYLESYYSSLIVANPNGKEVAFSDGSDVRIYHLDNLIEEAASVRARQQHYVSALAFSPDGKTLATGYSDGSVAFFNPTTGRRQFVLDAPPGDPDQTQIASLAFADNGRRLRTLNAAGEVASFDLDRQLIREQVQGGERRLVAFSNEQIGQWELDKALDYNENFELLAHSGDGPLIRSFFNFFSSQGRLSNNIRQVRDYCQRAADLYDQLDPETRKAQEETLIWMYDDYFWKLVQRNQPAEVDVQVAKLQQRLGRMPLGAVRASAHAALLRGDLRKAARQYTDWTIRSDEEGSGFYDYQYLDIRMQGELDQMNEYGLLDQPRRDLICALFKGQLYLSEDFCPTGDDGTGAGLAMRQQAAATLPLDNEARLRWQVFLALREAGNSTGKMASQTVDELTRTLQQARQLVRLNPQNGRLLLEKNLLALANAYKKVAELEQGNARAVAQYQAGIATLRDNGRFTKGNELTRLDLLGTLYLQLGNCWLNNDPAVASVEYQKGLQLAPELDAAATANGDNAASYANRITGPLQVQLGKAYLLLNQPAKARTAFEEAGNVLSNGLNGLYLAHAALLENDEIEALLNYGDIDNEAQAALAFGELHQIADRSTADRAAYLRNFAGRVRGGLLANHPEFDVALLNYRFAEERLRLAGSLMHWDSANYWANVAYSTATNWLATHDPQTHGDYYTWVTRVGDAMLNVAYYALYRQGGDRDTELRRAIKGSKEAYNLTQSTYYESRGLLWTNEGHAYLLLGQTDEALKVYQEYISDNQYGVFHPVDVLLKDWRDLQAAGVKFPPGLQVVAKAILPEGVTL